MNGKQAKRARRAAARILMDKIEDVVALAQAAGTDPAAAIADLPQPKNVYRQIKRLYKRGVR